MRIRITFFCLKNIEINLSEWGSLIDDATLDASELWWPLKIWLSWRWCWLSSLLRCSLAIGTCDYRFQWSCPLVIWLPLSANLRNLTTQFYIISLYIINKSKFLAIFTAHIISKNAMQLEAELRAFSLRLA